MTTLDDQPFIREMPLPHADSKVVVSLAVTNERLHVVNDICNVCKLKIANEGKPFVAPQVATLQPTIAPSTPIPELRSVPSVFETTPFTPSQPASTNNQTQNG